MSDEPRRRAAGTRGALAVASLLVVACVLLLHLWPAHDLDAGPFARLMADRLPVAEDALARLAECAPARKAVSGDHARLALGITAAEKSMRNPVETLVEDAIIRAAAAASLSPPDLSLGWGQIRPRHYAAVRQTFDGYWDTVADPCASLEFAAEWVALRAGSPIDLPERHRLAALWSGQPMISGGVPDPTSAAYFRYFDLVYRRTLGLRPGRCDDGTQVSQAACSSS